MIWVFRGGETIEEIISCFDMHFLIFEHVCGFLDFAKLSDFYVILYTLSMLLLSYMYVNFFFKINSTISVFILFV